MAVRWAAFWCHILLSSKGVSQNIQNDVIDELWRKYLSGGNVSRWLFTIFIWLQAFAVCLASKCEIQFKSEVGNFDSSIGKYIPMMALSSSSGIRLKLAPKLG